MKFGVRRIFILAGLAGRLRDTEVGMGRKLCRGIILLMLLSVAIPGVAASREKAMDKLHWWVVDRTKDGAKAEFFVIMKDQADVSPAGQFQTKLEKGWFVYLALTEKAERTQKPIRDILDRSGLSMRALSAAMGRDPG